eukprot:6974519-Lingulodinium_polyedra.AAC.1
MSVVLGRARDKDSNVVFSLLLRQVDTTVTSQRLQGLTQDPLRGLVPCAFAQTSPSIMHRLVFT